MKNPLSKEDLKIMKAIEEEYTDNEYDEEVEGIVCDLVSTGKRGTEDEGWNG